MKYQYAYWLPSNATNPQCRNRNQRTATTKRINFFFFSFLPSLVFYFQLQLIPVYRNTVRENQSLYWVWILLVLLTSPGNNEHLKVTHLGTDRGSIPLRSHLKASHKKIRTLHPGHQTECWTVLTSIYGGYFFNKDSSYSIGDIKGIIAHLR